MSADVKDEHPTGRGRFVVWLDDETHRRLKRAAALDERPMYALTADAIRDYLDRRSP